MSIIAITHVITEIYAWDEMECVASHSIGNDSDIVIIAAQVCVWLNVGLFD